MTLFRNMALNHTYIPVTSAFNCEFDSSAWTSDEHQKLRMFKTGPLSFLHDLYFRHPPPSQLGMLHLCSCLDHTFEIISSSSASYKLFWLSEKLIQGATLSASTTINFIPRVHQQKSPE